MEIDVQLGHGSQKNIGGAVDEEKFGESQDFNYKMIFSQQLC